MRHELSPVVVGDRVCFQGRREISGTIQGFTLSEYPFYVKWDKGTDDWYKAADLKLIDYSKMQPLSKK